MVCVVGRIWCRIWGMRGVDWKRNFLVRMVLRKIT